MSTNKSGYPESAWVELKLGEIERLESFSTGSGRWPAVSVRIGIGLAALSAIVLGLFAIYHTMGQVLVEHASPLPTGPTLLSVGCSILGLALVGIGVVGDRHQRRSPWTGFHPEPVRHANGHHVEDRLVSTR